MKSVVQVAPPMGRKETKYKKEGDKKQRGQAQQQQQHKKNGTVDWGWIAG